MLNFDFYSPTKIYFGSFRELEVGKIIKEYGYSKILLHYGKGSIKKNGLYGRVIDVLKQEGIKVFELGGVEANPKVSLVREGIKLARENQVEMILAVGGGSVIDSSKAIACGYYLNSDPWLLNAHEIKPTKALPIGVILTISAAGSELSNSCVLTNDETKVKSGFNNDIVRPLFSIMNPELTFTVSRFQTGCGIVDIMMHTMERYLTNVGNNEFASRIAEGLLKAVISAGKIAIEEPENYEARATLMIASSFSHNGLTGLGSKMYFTVHKLEHEISGTFDYVAHGAGLSVLFLAWAKYVYKDFIPLFSNLAYGAFEIDKSIEPASAALKGILFLESYFKRLNMPTTLYDLNVDMRELDNMANRLTKDDTIKIPGIRQLNKADIMEIFRIAKGGN